MEKKLGVICRPSEDEEALQEVSLDVIWWHQSPAFSLDLESPQVSLRCHAVSLRVCDWQLVLIL